jgi:hypothetical protein
MIWERRGEISRAGDVGYKVVADIIERALNAYRIEKDTEIMNFCEVNFKDSFCAGDFKPLYLLPYLHEKQNHRFEVVAQFIEKYFL